jgi:ABC-type nitrate/sulfonate/bicarbonate transport system substrate-binding protein
VKPRSGVLMLFLRNSAIAILFLCTIGIGASLAAERGRERVLVAVSSKSIGFFDPWVAHEKGFFRKYGIDSQIITMRPNLSVVALHAGEIDYSWMTGTVIRAAAKGLPLKLVTIGLKSSFHTLVARPNLQSINELRGKKIPSRTSARPMIWSLAPCSRKPA